MSTVNFNGYCCPYLCAGLSYISLSSSTATGYSCGLRQDSLHLASPESTDGVHPSHPMPALALLIPLSSALKSTFYRKRGRSIFYIVIRVGSTFVKEDIWTLPLRASNKDVFGRRWQMKASSCFFWRHWQSSWEPRGQVVTRSLLGDSCWQWWDPPGFGSAPAELSLFLLNLRKHEICHWEGIRKTEFLYKICISSNRLNKCSKIRI